MFPLLAGLVGVFVVVGAADSVGAVAGVVVETVAVPVLADSGGNQTAQGMRWPVPGFVAAEPAVAESAPAAFQISCGGT